MVNRKNIIEKWSNDEFLSSVSMHIDSIVSNRASIEHADLSGISIGPDALLNELKNKSLYRAIVKDSNLSHARISGSMSNSLFVRVDLTKSNLDGCVLLESHIVDCNLSESKLILKMDDTICENSNFSGARIGSGSSGVEYGGRRVKFINCNFTDVIFNRVELRASKFINCNFNGAKFINCDLRGVKVEGGTMPLISQFEKMDPPTWAQ